MIKTNKSINIFIIAGEESADNHGAALINALKKINSEIKFSGIGGKKMIKTGLKSMEDINKLSVMGFVEIIKHLNFFNDLTKRVINEIKFFNPDQIILIDYPGFNLRLAKIIKERYGTPITYYISPQVWAWKERRIEIIRKCIDQMLVIFPFEKEWYEKRGISVKYVGHPIFDEWIPSEKKELCEFLELKENKPIITLYPGSRMQELKRHLPLFIKTAKFIRNKNKEIQFVLGLAKNLNLKNFIVPNWIKIETRNPQKALECANLAIVSSGTATIEATVFGTAMIVVYKMKLLSWWLSKIFIKIKYAGMVNIIANKEIVPEFLQNNAKAKLIGEKALNILNNSDYLAKINFELSNIKNKLQFSNASKIAAKHILSLYKFDEK